MRTQQVRNKKGVSKTKIKDEQIMKAFKNLETLIGKGKVSGKAVTKRKTVPKKKSVEDSKKRKREEVEKNVTEDGTEKDEKVRKKRRLRPGTKALREIKNQQKTAQDKNAIAKKSFENLVREVIDEVTPDGSKMRIGQKALGILQEVAEGYLVQCLSLGHTLDIEIGKRSSITKKGVQSANTLLTKSHLLNNSVRSTDLLGEFTEAFPKGEDSGKKRVYKKKKGKKGTEETKTAGEDNMDAEKGEGLEDGDKEKKRENSVDMTAQKGEDDSPEEAVPQEETTSPEEKEKA